MNTEDIEKKLEQFRKYMAEIVAIREDLMVNAPDEETCDIYGDLHELARKIDQEFAKTFPAKLAVETDDTSN